jgi:hypothetical protein
MTIKSESKSTDYQSADDLRVAMQELHQSIAYLSKMVLQLQRSMNNKQVNETPQPQKPNTIH